jgi:asparagine synthetase B (glutamine-hydrolysing)
VSAPEVSFAGAWRARPEVRARLEALGAIVVDDGPLTLASSEPAGTSGNITAVLAGRLSDRGRLDAALPETRELLPARALARARERLGERAFDLLRGEWVAVVWDAERQSVTVARDPLGGRSVHYVPSGGGAVFGEEVRDVLALLPATPGPDRRSLSSWLAYGVTAEAGTLYSGIARLRPGELLRLDRRALRVEPMRTAGYQPPDPQAADPARMRAAVDAAVERAAPGGWRTGILLSGGLDSAIVAGAATAVRPAEEVVACSATFPGDREADEGPLIEELTRHLRLSAIRSVVDRGRPLLGGLRYLEAWRVPSTSPNTFLWLPLLERAAAEGVEVVLDGQGGDELFDQRPFYLFADLVARGRLRTAWDLTLRYPGTQHGIGRRQRARILRHFLRRGLMPLPLHRRLDRRRALRGAGDGLLRSADAVAAAETIDAWAWLARDAPRWWAYRHDSLVRVPQLLDAPGSLRRTAALAGLADRHPLMLDQELVEYALTVPPESSFDPRFDRPLARASQSGRLPDAVRLRPDKSGFSGVLTTSLQGERDVLSSLLDPRTARVREFTAPGALATLSGRIADPRADHAAAIWQLATAECWLRQLENPDFAGDLAASYAAPPLEHRIVHLPPIST